MIRFGAMNARHVFAPALLGWYLLAPPMKDGAFDAEAPFSQWLDVGEFDTVDACHGERDKRIVQFHKEQKPDPMGFAWLLAHQCIASDDPRLAR